MSDLALLSTQGIQDPNVRNFLDRFVQVWQQKMSGEDSLVSRSQVGSLAASALMQSLSNGVIGGANGGLQDGVVEAAIENLTNAIRNSIVQQVLEQNVQPKIEELIGLARGGQDVMISSEIMTRSNQMNVIASAINRIWGYIGGSTAVIEDGSLASVTPSSSVATKWNTVIAAVTDPNTGNVSSASILSETRAYANSADSTFNAIYSVKASVSAGGQTVVGGFALAASGGAGSAQGPTIDFGVLANKFYIAAPSSGYNPATEYSTNNQFPFIVVTTPTVINGVTYAAGVYMKRAAIGEAAIGSAQIAAAAITNAKISGTLSSDDWTGAGGAGWAIVKSGGGGNAWFNNIYARGDIQATSLTAGTVFTSNIVGAQVTSTYAATGLPTASVSLSAASGDNALVILAYTGPIAGSETSGSGMMPGFLQINGSVVASFNGMFVYSIANPSGSYTVTVSAGSGGATPASSFRVIVLHTKR